MSRRYTPAEKQAALDALHHNRYNIPLTARQLGIPERTLFAWRRQLPQLRHTPPPLPPPPPDPIPEFESTTEAMIYIRQRIINELLTLIQSFEQDFAVASPYQRVLAMSQLLDRVLKLDHYTPPEENVIRIEYEDPDDAFR